LCSGIREVARLSASASGDPRKIGFVRVVEEMSLPNITKLLIEKLWITIEY
jgi:hypothetical protein